MSIYKTKGLPVVRTLPRDDQSAYNEEIEFVAVKEEKKEDKKEDKK